MTTKLPRHGAVVSIDNPTSPVDISSTVMGVKIDPTKALSKVHTMDTRYGQGVEGGALDMTVTIRTVRTTGATEAFEIFSAWLLSSAPAARTLTVDWPNSNAGSKRLTGEFNLKSFQVADREAGSADAEILEAVLESDATFTVATI